MIQILKIGLLHQGVIIVVRRRVGQKVIIYTFSINHASLISNYELKPGELRETLNRDNPERSRESGTCNDHSERKYTQVSGSARLLEIG